MSNHPYKPNIGAVIRGLLNGVKHIPETAGPVIGVDAAVLAEIIDGKRDLTPDVEQAICSITGINQRDLYPDEFADDFPVIDDTDHGVRIMRASETMASARTLSRGPELVPYYIYADTAMSNTSTFRPEWIQELYVHDGETADLPDWAFNKGHFEHQVTYFIGPVNFYWIDRDGKRHVRKMNTGDTNYIVPFTPHTFTTRVPGEGLILAVTYGGAIANPKFKSQLTAMSVENYLQDTKQKLTTTPFTLDEGVVGGVAILHHKDSQGGNLVHCDYQPGTNIRELAFGAGNGEYKFESDLSDRWVYNIGDAAVTIAWSSKTAEVQPGDSVFIKSGTAHTFTGGEGAKLLVVDIQPGAGDPYVELKAIETYSGDAGLSRVHTETTRWY